MTINTERPVVGRKYRVAVKDSPYVEVGDIVEFLKDDGSIFPWFKNLTRDSTHNIAIGITSLEEYNQMDNLQPGTVLVRKSEPSIDHYLVLGVYEYEDDTKVAVADLFDDSLDTRSVLITDLVREYHVKGESPVESEIKEVTLKEVADKMGISVDKLRIKEED